MSYINTLYYLKDVFINGLCKNITDLNKSLQLDFNSFNVKEKPHQTLIFVYDGQFRESGKYN